MQLKEKNTQNIDSTILLSHCLSLSLFPPNFHLSTVIFTFYPLTAHLYVTASSTSDAISPLIWQLYLPQPPIAFHNYGHHCSQSACGYSCNSHGLYQSLLAMHALQKLWWQVEFAGSHWQVLQSNMWLYSISCYHFCNYRKYFMVTLHDLQCHSEC